MGLKNLSWKLLTISSLVLTAINSI